MGFSRVELAPAWRAVSGSPQVPMPSPAEFLLERERLLREKEQLTAELRVMQLKVEKLQRQLWDRRSERLPAGDPGQRVVFDEAPASAPAAKQRPVDVAKAPRGERAPKGPRPLDPARPREVIRCRRPI